MRKLISLTLIAAALAAPAIAANGIQVNGALVPQSRIDAFVAQMQQQGQPDSPQLREAARDRVVMTELLRQEALKKGIDKSSEYKTELENVQAALLANLFVRDFSKSHPVSEADMRAEYNRLKAQSNQKEFRARHILVKTEAEAAQVLEQLKKGKKFEDLARERSQDTGSKEHGGDLGYVNPQALVPEFSNAMVKLQKGQITAQPVKSQFGYHIIQLIDVKDADFPAFEQVKPQLEQQIQGKRFETFLADLKKKAKISQ